MMTLLNYGAGDRKEGADEITLRPLDAPDVDNLMTWVNDPTVVGKFATFKDRYSREDEEAYIRKILASRNDIVYSVECNGRYAGQIGLHDTVRKNDNGRLATVLKKEFQSHGYGEHVIKKFLGELFGKHGMHRVFAIIAVDNERMQHVLKKVGFVYEGTNREEYKRDGKYLDMKQYSILDHEFFARYGKGVELNE